MRYDSKEVRMRYAMKKKPSESRCNTRLSDVVYFIPTLTSLLFLLFIPYISSGFKVIICTEIHTFYTFNNDSVVKSVVRVNLPPHIFSQFLALGSSTNLYSICVGFSILLILDTFVCGNHALLLIWNCDKDVHHIQYQECNCHSF